MKQVNLILASNIQSYRKKLGLTQVELGDRLGVTPQAVSKWEKGASAPDISLIPVLASLFGCQINELFLPSENKVSKK
ncbi:MAG: helix-turn-helix transcriptional regulator [Clostridia bacterium]|nr:helix-turn-helix transcriptional regulator [Clostridia bacterium]